MRVTSKCMRRSRLALLALIALLLVPAILFSVAQATTVTVLDGAVSIADTANSNTVRNGTVTITAKGSLLSKKTNTITITNDTADTAALSFSYAASKYSSFTIAGASAAASGTYSATLKAGGTVTIVLTSNSGLSNTTATLTLSNFSCTAVSADATATVTFDSAKGSVSLAGTAISSGASVAASNGQLAAVATPASGCTFIGWVNSDNNELLSTVASATLNVPQNMNIHAVFVNSTNDTPWFVVDTKYLVNNLTTAGTLGSVIVLANNGTLPSGTYTIAAGDTLLVPYDSSNTLCTTKPTFDGTTGFLSAAANDWVKPTAYRTLTMANGANIVVNGAISISGKMCGDQTYNGSPTGPLGFITMEANSNITVNSGGFLYAWGYVTGSGSVTVKSGGTVYECFQIRDWRGGSAASAMIDKSQRVFPISQYYVQNVEVPMTLESGATEYGYTGLVASRTYGEATVPFIGTKGMFRNSGSIVKDYIEESDRLQIDITGNLTMSNLNISVSGYNMQSANYVLPLANHFLINIHSGTTTIGQDMCMLPGCVINIADGANIALASGVSFFVYDTVEWMAKNFIYSSTVGYSAPHYANKGNIAKRDALTDAKIVVNGTLDASAGYLYTTASGANITSDCGGQVKIGKVGSSTITYQATQSGTNITFQNVSIVPAWLQNGNGSYLQSGSNTYTYCSECLTWVEGAVHQNGSAYIASNLELGNSLNFHFAFYNDHINAESGHYIKIGDQQFDFTQWKANDPDEDGDVDYYIVVYSGLTAKQMKDTVTVTLYDGDGQVVDSWSDSIYCYSMRILEKNPNNALLKSLIFDMLNYGAACQTLFGYKTNDLANSGITGSGSDFTFGEAKNPYDSAVFGGSNLITTGNIQFALNLKEGASADSATYEFIDHWGDRGYTVTGELKKTTDSNGKEYYYVDGLVVADANSIIKIYIDGEVVYEDSIAAYCTRMYHSKDAAAEQKAAFLAFMRFSDSAEKYLEGGKI